MRLVQISPRIYEDETIYSIAARLILNDLSASVCSGMTNVLGSRNFQIDSGLPSFLPRLAEATGCETETLLNKHSLFNFYSMFSVSSAREAAKEMLLNGNSSGAFKALGMLANRINDERFLKFCPQCMREWEFAYGDLVWLRDHQLPLVSVCTHHRIKLVQVERRRYKLTFPHLSCEPQINESVVDFKIADFSRILPTLGSFEPQKLRLTYLQRLAERGLATDKTIYLSKWRPELREYYSHLLIDERVAQLLTDNREHGFPANIFYNKFGSHHPLKHILIICFLFEHVGDFVVSYSAADKNALAEFKLSQPTQQSEIDDGRREKILYAVRKKMSLRRTMKYANVSAATVRNIASSSGLTLERKEQKLTRDVVRSITLRLLVGYKTQEIAELVGVLVGDVEQILTGQPEIKLLRKRIRFYSRRQTARSVIKSEMACCDRFRVKDAKERCYSDYMWLYKHDREWLKQRIDNA